jgi:hypothetical protein
MWKSLGMGVDDKTNKKENGETGNGNEQEAAADGIGRW